MDAGASTDDWFARWVASRSVSDARSAADTSRYFKYVPARLRAAPLQSVTRAQIRRLVDALLEDGVGPYTVDAVLAILRGVQRLAVEEGCLRTDKSAGIAVDLARPLNKVDPEDTLSRLQTRLIEDAITPMYALWVHLAAVVGLTRAEIIGLTTDDVHLSQQQIRVSRALTEQRGKFTLKEVSPRVIPVERETIQALQYHLTAVLPDEVRAKDVERWLVVNERGKHPFSQNVMTSHLQPAVAKAGLNRAVTTQVLRHSAVRYYVEKGASPEVVQQRMGYGSLSTVVGQYGRFWQAFSPKDVS